MFSGAALALTFAACSSNSNDESNTDGPGGGGGAGGNGPGDINYTLDNVCEHLARKECAAAQSCCESSGIGYDQAACEAASRKACGKTVAKVRAGKMTFDPIAVDGCLAAVAKRYGKCELTILEDWDVYGTGACWSVFEGTVGEGGACEDVEECAVPTEEDTTVFCLTGTCDWGPISYYEGGKGEDCGIMKAYCERGLYCAPVSDPESAYPGKCADAKKVGEACEGVESDECLSWNCRDGKCAEAEKYFVVSDEICRGQAS